MEILSISVNGRELILGERKNNTTSWYELFMEYCIENHRESILSGVWLSEKFSLNPQHPAFGKAINWNRVKRYEGVCYHNWIDNRGKYRVIEKIRNKLNLDANIAITENA